MLGQWLGLPYHDFAHSVGDLAEACTVIRRLWTSAGFPHIILSLPAPYPERVAQWVADEIINESA